MPTDGSGPITVGWSAERPSLAVHGQTRMPNAPAVSKSVGSLLLWLRIFFSENKTLNCQLSTASKLLPVKPVANRLLHRQIHAKVKRTGSFPDKVGDYAPVQVVSLQGVIPRRYALRFGLLSTAPCKSMCARVRRMALSADYFDFLDCPARHSADFRV
jgi:hypothetical protein